MRKSLLVSLIARLASGCMVGPDYVRQSVSVPPAYKETGDSIAAATKAPLPRSRWWALYNDPELNALVEQVEVGNQTLQVAEARVRQAAALVDVAGAGAYPTGGIGTVNKNAGFQAASRYR